MPKYEPEKWNKEGIVTSNNCYNYATDNRNEPVAGRPAPRSATPGHAAGIEPGLITLGGTTFKMDPDGKGGFTVSGFYYTYTCKSIAIGCRSDGLKDPDKTTGKCESTCWKVAYFVRMPNKNQVPVVSGDYHFVRQDDDDKWSHKPNAQSEPVTRKQYNPKTKKYGGPDIPDPPDANTNVGPDYTFCGFLCCCPNTKVAVIDPPALPSGQEYALADINETAGRPPTALMIANAGFMDQQIGLLAAEIGSGWIDDFWDGEPCVRLDFGPNRTGAYDTLMIYRDGLTVWRGFAQSLADPKGIAAAVILDMLQTAPVQISPERGFLAPGPGLLVPVTRHLPFRRGLISPQLDDQLSPDDTISDAGEPMEDSPSNG